ncbi:MAG: hypothetical protein ACUVX1_13260 [Chloroflexota bacterium]
MDRRDRLGDGRFRPRLGTDQVFFQVFDFRDLAAVELVGREVAPSLRS